MVGGTPELTVDMRAELRRWRALPVTTLTRQGCRLGFGVAWGVLGEGEDGFEERAGEGCGEEGAG